MLVDSGYCSEQNLAHLEQREIEALIATERHKHGEQPVAAKRGLLPKGAMWADRMRPKLQAKAGRAVYPARQGIVESAFGQIKQERRFRQFLFRGLEKVRSEWALVCLKHNILKLHRICHG